MSANNVAQVVGATSSGGFVGHSEFDCQHIMQTEFRITVYDVTIFGLVKT